MTSRDADSGSRARIRWISGPVLRAATEGPFRLRESIRDGEAGLLGEVIRLQEGEIVAQVYEDTTGLRPGVVVEGTGSLLSILLGPHLLGTVPLLILRSVEVVGLLRRARWLRRLRGARRQQDQEHQESPHGRRG